MAMQNNSFSVLFFIYFLDTNVEGSTDGLLAYWKFNEGNGKTIKDHSGNGNTLPKKNNIKFNTKKYETNIYEKRFRNHLYVRRNLLVLCL